MKLKAGALLYVLVVAFLGSLMTSFFLLKFDLENRETSFYLREYRLRQNAASGIQYVMAAGGLMNENEEISLDFGQNENEKVMVKKRSWGIFTLAFSHAMIDKKEHLEAVLTGSCNKEKEKTSVYLADLERPLYVCGKTILDGVCYLPAQPVKRAYIEGQSYSGSELIYGIKRNSKRNLPEPEKSFVATAISYIKNKVPVYDSIISIHQLETDTVIHSFLNRTLVLSGQGNIELSSGHFEGNIIFISPYKITVKPGAKLVNVLLFAPEIEIESNNGSTLQAFARDKVILKEKSELAYPSVLGVLLESNYKPAEESENEFTVILEKKTKLAGSLVAIKEKGNDINKVIASVGEESHLIGELYSDNLAEIKGEVSGTVYCEKFHLKTTSSFYENHLLNAVINGNKKPGNFCGLTFKETDYYSTILTHVR